MTSATLLASAPSLPDLEKAIQRFYCGEAKRLTQTDETTWRVSTQSGKPLIGVIVRKEGKRYRFEMA